MPAKVTETPTITDEQILHLWDTRVGEPTDKRPLTDSDKLAFARVILSASAAPTQEPSPETVHPCGRGHILDLFDQYADATDNGYWTQESSRAAVGIIEAMQDELREHGTSVAASAAQPGVMQQWREEAKRLARRLADNEFSNDHFQMGEANRAESRRIRLAALLAHLSAVPAGVDVPHGGQQ